MLVLILAAGIYLSVRSGFAQIFLFPQAVRQLLCQFHRNGGDTSLSPFQALCTALAATVGTGNLVGVAGAICLGGPGAVFWMWLCAAVGMATKFAEAVLAVRYRCYNGREYIGGPMYYMVRGLGKRWRIFACIYSILGMVAAFGVGNAVQINAIITGINSVVGSNATSVPAYRNLLTGVVLSVLIGLILFGGAVRIGRAAEVLVPVAAGIYILLCIGVLVRFHDSLPQVVHSVFTGAFAPRAVTGGMIGSAFMALRVGCARGVFSNEAGMGTAAIAHAGADVMHPVQQGTMGLVEVFLDTIVICTLTALAILCSGCNIPYGTDVGAELTTAAFSAAYGPWAGILIAACLCCFAFATILGWGLYGIRCCQFLLGNGAVTAFLALQLVAVVIGAVMRTQTVWLAAETVNGLMAIPNLLALVALSPELGRLTKEYKFGRRTADGGYYANIYQCEQMRTLSHEKVSSSGNGSSAAG